MRAFIILGPPRTGTSLVAGILHESGISMGERFVPLEETPASPTGCYEDIEFVSVNCSILNRKGRACPKIVLPPTPLEPLTFTWRDRQEVESLLSQKLTRCHAVDWGWKDMRTCFLLDLYGPHFDQLNAHLIVTHRSLDRAAHSWQQLKKCSYETSLLAMAAYYGRAMAFLFENAGRWPVLHLNFDDWFDSFPAQARRLETFVGVSLNTSIYDAKQRHF